jgi:uncharacterized phage protein (TIGR01671 family)
MNGDLLKFRVWNSIENKYSEEPFFIDMLGDLIKISEFDDNIDRVQDRDKFSVERCTGLKDKNGTLIFEGDIVKPTDPEEKGLYVVEWDNSTYGFSFQKVNGFKSEKFYYLYSDDVVIVGNIHEVEG